MAVPWRAWWAGSWPWYTMWAFTFLDSLASGASTSMLGRAGTALFASARNERSIKAFRDCYYWEMLRKNFEDRETYYKWLFKEPDERFEAFLGYVEKEEEKLQKLFLVKN
ncbi:hypothetical protein SELMODRAFT_428856 [Selaginella moellendorffii]|uniref:Uncharacterized protein n=1 Tax=Selaginella moellendorffii TaxID=88036 RepID=D8T483_SELML|nr:hypothetical protein SELMODRAFT_428856 [Selaginella moellendorffii]